MVAPLAFGYGGSPGVRLWWLPWRSAMVARLAFGYGGSPGVRLWWLPWRSAMVAPLAFGYGGSPGVRLWWLPWRSACSGSGWPDLRTGSRPGRRMTTRRSGGRRRSLRATAPAHAEDVGELARGRWRPGGAAQAAGYAAQGLPRDLVLCYRDPAGNVTAWASFVERVVAEHGSRLAAVQVSAEANLAGIPAAADGAFPRRPGGARAGPAACRRGQARRRRDGRDRVRRGPRA